MTFILCSESTSNTSTYTAQYTLSNKNFRMLTLNISIKLTLKAVVSMAHLTSIVKYSDLRPLNLKSYQSLKK